MTLAAVAIGSNLGNRESHLDFARARLGELLAGIRVSSPYETPPEGMNGPQSLFLNAAAVGETTMDAQHLLDALLAIEAERGRARPFPLAPRTLDLDLVLFGDQVIDEPALTVPHPRFRNRRFVLEPLAEIAASMKDPVTGRSVGELFAALTRSTPDREASRL